MKTVKAETLIPVIIDLCIRAAYNLPESYLRLIKKAAAAETGRAAEILKLVLKNARIAKEELYPLCQDTGSAVLFIEIGQEIFIKGDINKAVDEGVRLGFKEGYLRKSIVSDPLFVRKNTADNTPAVVHFSFIKGDKIKIKLILKGGGAENTSKLKMFNPSDGKAEIISFIRDTVKAAGAKACPPLVIGVGIGGNFEECSLLAKKALLRKTKHKNKMYRQLEDEALNAVNELNIGPQGLGGKTTALAVFAEYAPCHMASLPVAVNICCHSHRTAQCEI